MRHDREARVGQPPGAPLLVFDGACAFCRTWVERWRGITGDRVEYRPAVEVGARFPEIGPEGFAARCWLIEPDGRASGGALAVLKLYALAGERRFLPGLYESVPAFAAAAESAYDLVARNRDAAATATRLLWGKSAERPRYRRARAIFLRALGLCFLCAFASAAVQVDGLIGSRGILPAAEFLDLAGPALGRWRYWDVPTLLWLDRSDRALHLLCWGGVGLGALLMVGVLPRACLALLWLGYLSLVSVGDPFLGYQWDTLLLEAGLMGVLLAPGGVWLARAGEPSRAAVWLVRWLLFRLMLLAGLVKLASGDPTWWAWEALQYHYETQPLPAPTSWYLHNLPRWFQAASVGFVFWAELACPLLIFSPRRPRLLAFWSFVLLQAIILASGNYGFFNGLTIALCLSLVEDRDWGRPASGPSAPASRRWWRRVPFAAAFLVIVALTTMESLDRSGWAVNFPGPLESLRRAALPLRSLNAYGLFAVMTTERPEIVVEGSEDGESWVPYPFRWKPGDPGRAPRFATPHLPRLDWQMWFAALSRDCRGERWFLAFEARLLEGSPEVLALLREDPFAGRRPRYVRARRYSYRFTGRGERDWWRREELDTFCPPVSPGPGSP